MRPPSLSRFTLAAACGFIVATLFVLGVYVWYLRNPYLGEDLGTELVQRLVNPQTPVEEVRRFAIAAHETVVAEHKMVMAAVHLCVVLSISAAAALFYVTHRLRKARGTGADAL